MIRVLASYRWRLVFYSVVTLWLVAATVLVPKAVSADEEIPPMFVADKAHVVQCEEVTFTNTMTGGTHPYTKAEWDFEADGVFDLILTGTEAEVMADVTHAYGQAGIYSVTLRMTDSTPTSYQEARVDYIMVAGITIGWNCPLGGQALIAPYPAMGRPFLTQAVACSDTGVSSSTAAQLWGIYYLDEAVPGGEWLYYIPGFSSSTITQLEPGKYYYVVVSDFCVILIPQ